MKLNKANFFLSLVALVFFAVSCTSSESDSDTSKTFTISDFSSLNVELVGEIIYEQSDSFYLNASGSSRLIEALDVSDKNGKLSIELKNKRKFSGNKRKLIIKVGSPQLQSINFQGVGKLNIRNHFKGDQLTITNKGVGEIMIDDCQVGSFKLTSQSVGNVEIKGTANEVFIEAEGIGNIDCSEFKAENAKVISKGAGNLSVYAEKSIDISLSGIGNVNYYGNPTEIKTDITGLGKVSAKGR